MSEYPQWEFQIVGIPLQADMAAGLNNMGNDGWEPSAVLGPVEIPGPDGQPVVLLQMIIKRVKRKISLSTDIQGALT